MDNVKLQTALIEIGKEAQGVKETPTITDIETEFIRLETGSYNNDMSQMRKACRRLAALTTKYMVDKL